VMRMGQAGTTRIRAGSVAERRQGQVASGPEWQWGRIVVQMGGSEAGGGMCGGGGGKACDLFLKCQRGDDKAARKGRAVSKAAWVCRSSHITNEYKSHIFMGYVA
jgi:hypothetical protein